MIFVLGIDAATWTVVRPNLDVLPCFKKLVEFGKSAEVVLKEKPVSPSIWCGMFSGKTYEEHRHDSFVIGDRLAKREDIPVDFVWDVLERQGKKVRALNIPFIVPPYSFRVDFKPVGFGLPTNEREWQEELDRVSEKIVELLAEKPDLLIAVYTLLDRVQHFHWGEECVLDWYRKLDKKMEEFLFATGFLNDVKNKLIVISDHGMCSFGEARVQTLPKETEWGELKGDHHENALLIAVNVDYAIEKPQDVFHILIKEFEKGNAG